MQRFLLSAALLLITLPGHGHAQDRALDAQERRARVFRRGPQPADAYAQCRVRRRLGARSAGAQWPVHADQSICSTTAPASWMPTPLPRPSKVWARSSVRATTATWPASVCAACPTASCSIRRLICSHACWRNRLSRPRASSASAGARYSRSSRPRHRQAMSPPRRFLPSSTRAIRMRYRKMAARPASRH